MPDIILKEIENPEFVKRFVEACGSSKATDIKRLLGVSYSAAKNYLTGRLPEPIVLITIGERTPFSIHWLMTGRGRKFVEDKPNEDTLRLTDQLREFVRQNCREIINELLSSQNQNAQSKAIVLSADFIKGEKAQETEKVSD